MADFKDKVAVVTGGGSGIGKACAVMLAERGAAVVVADVNFEAAEAIVDEIGSAGGEAAAFRADVSQTEACYDMVSVAVERWGGLDVAVNNAGIGMEPCLTGNCDARLWREVMAVNLDGVFFSMRAELAAMLEQGGGSIVNMASVLGSVGFAQACAYVAAKHGVVGITRTAAIEYATQGIRVNAVGPGFIETPLFAATPGDLVEGIAAMHPLGRLGQSHEVAELVAFLASDRASNTTGAYYVTDGGYTAQ